MNNKNTKESFYIYIILDINNIPIYVGRTNNVKRRMGEHKRDMRNKKYYLYNKLRKMQSESNYEFTYEVILENLTYEESVQKEIDIIAEYKQKNITLCNLTEGGEGLNGVTREFTDEHKNNLKVAAQNKVKNGWKPANTGLKIEELVGEKRAKELKEISSKTHKGKAPSNKGKLLEEVVGVERAKEIKKQISERAKETFKRPKTEEWKSKIGEANRNKAKNYTFEEKERRREISRNNAIKNLPRYNFKVTFQNGNSFILENSFYKELIDYLLNNYNIKLDHSTIKNIISGNSKVENSKHKINFELI